MAKLLFSALVDGVRGRVGGIIFSANAAGPAVRRYAPPIRSNTPIQVSRRGIFSQWGAGWRGLTAAQRTAWNVYAANILQAKTDALGNIYYLNGYQWFVSMNSNRNLVGRSQLSNAPSTPVPAAPTIGTLLITAPGTAGCQQALTVASFGAFDLVAELYFSPSNAKLSTNARDYRFVIGVQTGAIVTPTVFPDLEPIFGTIQSGSYWTSRIYVQTVQGRRSAYSQANIVAV